MTVLKTLLVNGTDLRALPGIIVNRLDLYAPGTRRGSADTIPGRQGQLGAALPYDAYAFAVAITVSGTTEWDMMSKLTAVGTALAGTSGLVTLTRRLPTSDTTTVDHTAKGQFASGLGFSLLNPLTGQTELQFVNLDGAWTPDAGATWLVP